MDTFPCQQQRDNSIMKSIESKDLPRSGRLHREKPVLSKILVRCASTCTCGHDTCNRSLSSTVQPSRPCVCKNKNLQSPLRSGTSLSASPTTESLSTPRGRKKFIFLCILSFLFVFCVFSWIYDYFSHPESAEAADQMGKMGFNPCCAFPCLHHGVCTSRDFRFECDCTGTGYSGQVCERKSWRRWLFDKSSFSEQSFHEFLGSYPWLWTIINLFPFAYNHYMKMIFLDCGDQLPVPTLRYTLSDYVTADSCYNRTLYARYLPPIPQGCPTEMGAHGLKKLPPISMVSERIFARSHFIPCPRGTNLFFSTYAQFFMYQFFRMDYKRGVGSTLANGEGVDLSQVYGHTEERRRALRSFEDGKLKTIVIESEDVPPTLNDTPQLFMSYPAGGTMEEIMGGGLYRQDRPVTSKWALGHPLFSMTPLLFVMSTLWVREHNRVCDVLKVEHPDWEDEQLYQTARLIVTGVQIKLTLTEYIQHFSQYNVKITYKPELLHGTYFQFQNRIFQEFIHSYHWHMQIPDSILLDDEEHSFNDLLFTDNEKVFKFGINRFLVSMFKNIAGKLTLLNHAENVECLLKSLLKHSRELRIQPFNNYRRAFGLPPYKDFLELTGDTTSAAVLKDLYGEVDAVEFYVGLLAEKHTFSAAPPSMVIMSGKWIIKALLSHPIGSPQLWKPSTFGGRKGWDIVRKTTLKDFVCRNVRGSDCKEMSEYIGYTVPPSVLEAAILQAAEQQMEMCQCPECEDDERLKEALRQCRMETGEALPKRKCPSCHIDQLEASSRDVSLEPPPKPHTEAPPRNVSLGPPPPPHKLAPPQSGCHRLEPEPVAPPEHPGQNPCEECQGKNRTCPDCSN